MPASPHTPGIAAGRLDPARLAENFADIAPALSDHEARVAADRCYFCHEAPCVAACPTGIDVPLFIREIAAGQPLAAGRAILGRNILGGMCARVCPTETLCEAACVREAAEGKPVEIGRLQRYATDRVMARPGHPFARAAASGRRVAVVGAGPAGLACAHRLALLGHAVHVFEARPKAGGLSEYGVAAYKTVGGFAQAELDWLLGVGGVEIRAGVALGRDVGLERLRADYDAVFLGLGLGGVRALGPAPVPAARPAVDFIAELRQADDLGRLPVGRRVLVIGGGMTAIDAAAQARLLGAEEVTIAYRRSRARMGASRREQDHAARLGVRILCNAAPLAVEAANGAAAVRLALTVDGPEGPIETGETLTLLADQVLIAIGQTLEGAPEALARAGARIAVSGPGRTSLPGVWAGGDCAAGGDELTVTAVAEGREAAIDIDAALATPA